MKVKTILCISMMAGILFASCNKSETDQTSVSVTGIVLDKTQISLVAGDAETLVATVLPEDATNRNVSWSSSDPAVATVDGGTVTAVAAGEAVITVTSEDGGKTAECAVTVTDAVVSVESVSLDRTVLEMAEGDAETLVATVLPEDATNRNVSWSSSDPAVATVDGGTVTAVAAGEAVITVTSEDGGKTAECAVTVTDAVVSVESVSLDRTVLEMAEGDAETLVATVLPEDATNRNVSWSSSDPAVATVDGGTVTAVAAGEAVITVTSEDGGKTAECAVTVSAPGVSIEGNTFSGDYIAFGGEGVQLSVNSDGAEWTSSDETVATVDGNGYVRFLNEKDDVSVQIMVRTATGEDGMRKFQCYKSVPYVNDTAYPDGTIVLPKSMRNFYIRYDNGSKKVDNSCYDFVVEDTSVMSAYKDDMINGLGVKGLKSGGTTTLTIIFNSGLEMHLNIVVEG